MSSLVNIAHLNDAMSMIRAERQRQITEEGYTAEYDKEHQEHEALVLAAATYEMEPRHRGEYPICWPFDFKYWKPGQPGSTDGRIRELVKSGALYMAAKDLMEAKEIEIPLKQAVCEKIDLVAEQIAGLLAGKEGNHV
jgi:hypothetical protein